MINKIVMLTDKTSVSAEAYRTLRTNIEFSSVDKKLKVLTVTSSVPEEGKSMIARNLAIAFAENGKKTLLLDSDLRRPTQHKDFKLPNSVGFVNVIVGTSSKEEAIQKNIVENLDILTSGMVPPNPSELIGSEKNKEFFESLKEDYDVVIVDSPPLLAVTDAQILTTLYDGTIIVVRYGKTKKDELERSNELLEKVHGNILGVVMCDIPEDDESYHYYAYEKQKRKRN